MKKLDLTPPVTPVETEQVPVDGQDKVVVSNQSSVEPDLESTPAVKKNKIVWSLVAVVVVVSVGLGVLTGFGASKLYPKNKAVAEDASITQVAVEGKVKVGDVFGSHDDSFKDEAIGYLEAGGIDGEGSHKLIRAGGVSQTVYLTSSVTDLDKFIGMDVKVYGETYQGQKAGWLMDVGRVEVISLDGKKPTVE